MWRLYDTYGFPVDLTMLMAEEAGLTINQKEFEEAQEKSKEASKGVGKKGDGQTVRLDVHDIAALEANDQVPKTDDSLKFGESAPSYPLTRAVERSNAIRTSAGNGNVDSQIKAIYHSSKFYTSTSEIPSSTDAATTSFGVILDKTNFYAESGGQEYDTGRIVIDGKADFLVDEVQVFNGYVLHIGHLVEGEFKVGDDVVAGYDEVSASR